MFLKFQKISSSIALSAMIAQLIFPFIVYASEEQSLNNDSQLVSEEQIEVNETIQVSNIQELIPYYQAGDITSELDAS